ncbi:MAG: hypothetical protein K9N62_13450 [Verrucomicrobia bacterium]|nr:hypothetical protein [Verrucomicrobiota bacterium]
MIAKLRHCGVLTLGLALMAPLGAVAQESLDESPERVYSTIIDRNPFGLKPPPPPPPPAEEVAPPEVKDVEIKLTGITSFGVKRAYFMVTTLKDKATDYYALGEAEKVEELEVLQIDDVNRNVRIRKSGVETLMSFVSHGIPAPAGAAPQKTVPGVPGGARITVPGGVPTPAGGQDNGTAGANVRSIRSIPTRAVRGQSNSSVGSIPSRYGLQENRSTNVPTPQTSDNQLSSEEQALLLELNKVANPNIILPPTPGIPQGPPGIGLLPALPGQ